MVEPVGDEVINLALSYSCLCLIDVFIYVYVVEKFMYSAYVLSLNLRTGTKHL
jgi:hypothetical protein